MPGVRELLLVALVVVAMYGRSPKIRQHRFFAPGAWSARPWVRRQPAALGWLVDRWVLVLAILAGAGIAAWVATALQVAQPWVVR